MTDLRRDVSQGRTAIITGGASGLGAAKRLGASRPKAARSVCGIINADALWPRREAETGAVHTVALDVSEARMPWKPPPSRKLEAALGKIDILVNSAGITGATHTGDRTIPIDSWLKVFEHQCERAVLLLPRHRRHHWC